MNQGENKPSLAIFEMGLIWGLHLSAVRSFRKQFVPFKTDDTTTINLCSPDLKSGMKLSNSFAALFRMSGLRKIEIFITAYKLPVAKKYWNDCHYLQEVHRKFYLLIS